MKKESKKMGFKDAKSVFHWYWKLIYHNRGWLIFTMLLYGVAIILSDVYSVVILKNIVDELAKPQFHLEELWYQVKILIGVALLYAVLYRLGDLGLRKYQVQSSMDLTRFTFAEVQKHSYTFYANTFVGSLTSQMKRFQDGFYTLSEALIFTYWWNALILTSILVTLFIFSWQLALVFLLCIGLLFAVALPFLKERMEYDEKEGEANSKLAGHFSDMVTNILNVKVFGATSYERQRFEDTLIERRTIENKSFKVWNKMVAIQAIVADTIRFGLLIFALWLWSQGEITAGTVVLVVTFTQSIFKLVFHFVRSTSNALKALASAKEMIDVFEKIPDIQDGYTSPVFKVINAEVAFQKVAFKYQNGEEVFKDLTFAIRPGEKVGLVGPSGGGKSTITKLLLRFIDPTNGQITIDNQNIKDIRQDDLRKAVAYVPQDPTLFHRSLFDNIAYGKPGATKEQVIEAAKKAHAHEFIEALEKGYETEVGERGIKLSGGQRQRIAIARAILKDAPILVMDEATSALDTVSEKAIRDSLDTMMAHKTVLIIAHRLSTVEKLDRIIVLDKNGAIREQGTHQELLENNDLYATLWNHQVGGFLSEEEA